jgi:murein DD-endopeptidase MepM/ murein hydrolase activator NlpD
MKRIRRFKRPIAAVFFILVAGLGLGLNSLSSAEAAPLKDAHPPFILPFAGEPGPDTWMFIQGYGNTHFAYRFRYSIYGAGQGIHFGIDLAAPCGTEVRAIGDGVVTEVDGWHGAGPHNLMIDHDNGYASFYGHLMVQANVRIGQEVQAGEVVGYSGDPDLTCTSRPHLHLEIRDARFKSRAFNPILLIDADWDRIVLMGANALRFEQDFSSDPRNWQTLFEQPEIHFGSPVINDYDYAWPSDW